MTKLCDGSDLMVYDSY